MSNSAQHILIVDQDRIADLISKMLADQYRTEVVTHGMWAFNKLQKNPPDAMVVDIDIPGNGLRLTELVGISPEFNTVPIILMSVKPTSDIIRRAKNAGASAYLAKPFGPVELQKHVAAVLTASKAAAAESQSDTEDGASAFVDRVKKIEGLPSFPVTHAEILKLSRSRDASSEDIAEKIQLDPGLLATVFKLVNASYYGFGRTIDSLNLAVTLLGFEEIANLVMTAQVFEKLGNYEEGGGLDLKAFWKHSLGTAFIAREIAKALKTESDSAFLSGMLHDLGKIILDRYFADYYGPVVDRARKEKLPIQQCEQEMLGVGHAEIGGQLAREWQYLHATEMYWKATTVPWR